MKIVRRGALPVGGDSGLLEIRDRALAGSAPPKRRGRVRDEDIWPGFVRQGPVVRRPSTRSSRSASSSTRRTGWPA